MPGKKWLAPVLPYLAVWAGLFLFKNVWAALLGFHLAIFLTLAAMRSRPPLAALLRSKHPRRLLYSVLFCGASGIGLFFFWDFFEVAPDLPEQLQSIGLNSSTWLPFIAYFSLVNPFIEEYFWRGALGGGAKGPYVTDFSYAGYHALILWGKAHPLSVLFALLALACAAWLWRQISCADDGLLAAVLGHAAADFSILTVVCWMCA